MMKKLIKTLSCLLIMSLLFLISSCGGNTNGGNGEVTIDSISVVETTIPESILNTNLDEELSKIEIKVVKSDDTVETIKLNKDMLSTEDYEKLQVAGTHTVTVNYEGKSISVTLFIKTSETQDPGDDPNPEKEKVNYSVLIKDIAGKPLAEFYVGFYLDNELVDEGFSNGKGLVEIELDANIYEVYIEGREGYYLNQDTYQTDLIGTQIVVECVLDDLSGKTAPVGHMYTLGDVMYNFELTDIEGEVLNLYDLLSSYKAVVLNFWYTTCSACYYEFPYMVEAYESTYKDINGNDRKYSDDIVIIAVNPTIAGNGDSLDAVKQFAKDMKLSFNVALDYDGDKENIGMDPALTTMFGVNAYPTTVIIDSYGLIAEIGVGAVTSTDKWTSTFDTYVDENYVPVYTGQSSTEEYIKPDITQADSKELEAAINGTNYDGTKFEASYDPEDNDDAEFSWPWVVVEFDGKKCIKPSNKDVSPSFAICYTTVYLKKGEVFTFDYYSSTEEYDTLYVTANGSIATSISGQSPDWEKSYAYVAIEDGEYEFGLCYLKDNSYSVGEDAVYITNVRIVQEKDIDKETYIFRECATGLINEFTMSYPNYASVVLGDDGYYHVGSATGPLLFADMLSGTQWNNSTLYEVCLEGLCIGADGIDYTDVIEEYSVYASNSSIGYTPVTEELANALKQVVKALGDEAAKENVNQWLEVCVYYSAYGTGGVELGLPIIGVTPFEPIMFEGNGIDIPATASATFDRIILPRGFIFGFIPEQSGVYKFYSTEELETVGYICDSEGTAIQESEYGLRIFAEQSSKGEDVDDNFVAYVYLEKGQLYLYRAAFYDIYEYSEISVEMKYVSESIELLTLVSPGYFTSSDDEMSDIISGNYVDVYLDQDGYYHVEDSLASDTFVYCDMTYINAITGYSLLDCLSERFNAFDFGKDEYGNYIYDEEGYYRITGYDNDGNLVRYYVCQDAQGETYYVLEVGADNYTEENGYTYLKFNEDDLASMSNIDCTQYVKDYVAANMITDENSELYGCVKVDERFATVLGLLMDKYTFAGVEYSWAKLCYYYKYVGPNAQ